MLYLEDYLESKIQFAIWFLCQQCYDCRFITFSVIEHLPSELRDRFFDMREMDLSVQSKCHMFRKKKSHILY